MDRHEEQTERELRQLRPRAPSPGWRDELLQRIEGDGAPRCPPGAVAAPAGAWRATVVPAAAALLLAALAVAAVLRLRGGSEGDPTASVVESAVPGTAGAGRPPAEPRPPSAPSELAPVAVTAVAAAPRADIMVLQPGRAPIVRVTTPFVEEVRWRDRGGGRTSTFSREGTDVVWVSMATY